MAAEPAPSTLTRRELKFSLPHADADGLCRLLEVTTKPVSFAGPVSVVHSLYFDDARLSSCRESLAGVGHRFKTRVRWYDTPLPEQLAFFEIKRRLGNVIAKERVPLEEPTALFASFEALRQGLARQLDAGQRAVLAQRPDPTALVSYRRRHFVDPPSGIRLTVDWGIEGFDQTGVRRLSRRFGAGLDGELVLEAKLPEGGMDRLHEILHPIGPRLTRFSKYLRCCQAVGLLWTPS